jgi:hypothetical protein
MKGSGILKRVWHWIKWPITVLAIAYIFLVAWDIWFRANERSTDAAVSQIHAQKITLADVEGKNLPPVPDQAENDATVAGIDKNNNGIRDDVELAIFKEYPNSEKIRAAELQYAMTEQMFLIRVFNEETAKAVSEESSRAASCISEVISGTDLKTFLKAINLVDDLVFNTKSRQDYRDSVSNYTMVFGDAPGQKCDVLL